MQVAITSLLLFFPRTSSSSRITFAGLKKCVPITASGRDVDAAISSISSVEVLLARIAPRLHTRSICANTSFFNAIPSKTASITRSAFEKSSQASVGLMSFIRSSTCSCVNRPRFTEVA